MGALALQTSTSEVGEKRSRGGRDAQATGAAPQHQHSEHRQGRLPAGVAVGQRQGPGQQDAETETGDADREERNPPAAEVRGSKGPRPRNDATPASSHAPPR